MKRFVILVLGCVLSLAVAAFAAEMPKIEQPLLLTSLGQCPDVHTANVLAKRGKLEGVDYKPMAGAADLDGKKTMLVVVGVSLKGFGAAGVNLDTETARANELFKAAKEKGIKTILLHIGGAERRDQMTNKLLEVAIPQADAFIVSDLGNADGYFNKAIGDKPVIFIPKTIELGKTFTSLKADS